MSHTLTLTALSAVQLLAVIKALHDITHSLEGSVQTLTADTVVGEAGPLISQTTKEFPGFNVAAKKETVTTPVEAEKTVVTEVEKVKPVKADKPVKDEKPKADAPVKAFGDDAILEFGSQFRSAIMSLTQEDQQLIGKVVAQAHASLGTKRLAELTDGKVEKFKAYIVEKLTALDMDIPEVLK